jgi:hypothetical protein
MVEVVDGETGEVREFEQLSEAAGSIIERPPYRRRAMHLSDGEWGREYNLAFLKAQKEIGPTIGLDAENAFNKSRYVTLPNLLARVQPILNNNGFIVNFDTGRVNYKAENKQQYFLPVYLILTHAETDQWKCVGHEIPILKFDPQSFGGTITYGRRYVLTSHMSIAGAEPDDDGVQATHQPSQEQLAEMGAALGDKIGQCVSEAQLHEWRKKHEQQFGLLDRATFDALKDQWQKRLNELRSKATKKGKNDV